jgi:tetratricopeptide (TPR) repeat protein
VNETKPIQIFISYAPKDKELARQLESHLQVLRRSGLIQMWSDRNIVPGMDVEQEVKFQLDKADIILLLISPSFFASDHYGIELDNAMKRAQQSEARVIPILLRSSLWRDASFANLQVLPRNEQAVTTWKNSDEAFGEIVQEIRKIVLQIQNSRVAEVDWESEGDRLMQLNQYEKALDAYERALQLDAKNAEAYVGKGNALGGLNKPVEALTSYESAIRLNPANVIAYINRGNVFRNLGRFIEALASYDLALGLDPKSYIPYLEKGRTLHHLGLFSEALDAYNQALTLAPNSASAYIGRGTVAIKLERYPEALADFNRALQFDSKAQETFFLRGTIYLQLGQYESAYEDFLQTIRLDSKFTLAYLGMGDALRKMRRDEEALGAYDSAIILDPSNAYAYQTKASILYELARDDEARLALYQAQGRGLNIEIERVGASFIKEDTEGILSQTRIDSVQQFLANAGFSLQTFPGEVGLMAYPKKQAWKMWFHKGLYIRILFDSQLDQRTVDAITRDARKHQCGHALVIINQQPKSSGWGQVNILRSEVGLRRFTCLPIDETLIQKGIAIHNEFPTLKQYITHRLGNGFDPYDEDSPVAGVVNFYGRQRITEELMDDLQHGRRLGLFGIQKMGKSSVLKELQLRASFPVAYVYLTVGESLRRIYKRILEEWATSGKIKYPDFKWEAPQITTESTAQSEFDAAAKGLLSYLDTLNTAIPSLAIFLDEIEHIVPSEGDERTMDLYIHLMDSLRGLYQETQSISLLVAGVYPGVARDNYFWGTQKNPMHQVIKEYFLPPLDEEDCTNMIRSLGEQINIQYEESALAYIVEMSGSHPLLTRRICSYAHKKLRDARPISVDNVEEVVQEFVRDPQKNAYFGENGLWKELGQVDYWGKEVSQANQQLLLKLAREEREMSERELCAGLDQVAATQAFYVLKERSIISSPNNSGYYHITFGLFKNWIRFRQLGMM